MKNYAAYGSNLNIGQMSHRCPGATLLGTAWLEDWQLLVKGSKTGSYLTIEPKKGSRVPLGIWKVSKASSDFSNLTTQPKIARADFTRDSSRATSSFAWH